MKIDTLFVGSFIFLGLSGCYSWKEIKPAELPKLNGGAVAAGVVASGTNRGQVVAVSVGQAEAPDGTLVEIKGEFDARVTEAGMAPLVFQHPVRSEADDMILTVQGSNRARKDFPVEDVQKVEVSQYDHTQTMLLSLVGGLAAGYLLFYVAVPSE
jgi:hypothetical protein